MSALVFGLLLFLAGFLIPRDAFPWMKRLSAWLMRNRDNTTLAYVVFVVAFLVLCLFVATGCVAQKPLKGGGATIGQQASAVETGHASTPASPDSPPVATLTPPENPAASSGQETSFEKTIEIFIPVESSVVTETLKPDGGKVTVTETFPAGTVRKESVKQGVKQSIGGAQKDMGREIGAALASFRWVQYIGAACLIIGVLGFFHPVVRGVIGGKDTAGAVGGCGLVMIFGPYLFVKYANWFALALVAAGGYWLVSRLKYKEGLLDANKNGVDDRLEPERIS